MGHFVSIRGWLEIDKPMQSKVVDLVNHFSERAPDLGVTQEIGKLYLKGWVFPESYINWTKYIFYGADIRTSGLKYLKEHFRAIAEGVWSMDEEIKDYVKGYIFLEDEDGEPLLFWKLEEGKLIENTQNPIAS